MHCHSFGWYPSSCLLMHSIVIQQSIHLLTILCCSSWLLPLLSSRSCSRSEAFSAAAVSPSAAAASAVRNCEVTAASRPSTRASRLSRLMICVCVWGGGVEEGGWHGVRGVQLTDSHSVSSNSRFTICVAVVRVGWWLGVQRGGAGVRW
jgi:hypothetical protein